MKLKWRLLIFAALAALIAGCSQLGYYVQAVQGQYALISDARPIEEWLADPAVEERLKLKLSKVRQIRSFAAQELNLPDNDSYKTYADLKRPYVLWNVVATAELSFDPVQWCFPVAGCVNYRGYYDRNEANAFAAGLREQGYDVQVAGVPAYSTLGWFNDPVLSTFIQYPEVELAKLVFHELAHQVVYAKDDSKFNESFAVAVEEAGIERWLNRHGDDSARRAYIQQEARKKDFLALLMKTRKLLEENYLREASRSEKRRQKTAIFQGMKEEYQVLKTGWGGYAGYDRWFAEPLTNAHLSAISTYNDLVPGFRAMLEQEKNFGKFYAAVRTLSGMEKSARHRQLAQLSQSPMTAQAGAGTSELATR